MMGTPGDDHSSNSSGKRFEVDKPRVSASEEILNKIDSLFREAGQAIQDMSLTHLHIVRGRVQAFIALVDMEEKWRHDEASQRVDSRCGEASPHPSARAERFASRLKRRRIDPKEPSGESKFNYHVHNGIVILGSDVDEPEYHQEVFGAVAKKDVGAAQDVETIGGEAETTVEGKVAHGPVRYGSPIVPVPVLGVDWYLIFRTGTCTCTWCYTCTSGTGSVQDRYRVFYIP